jgi:drug/metabolite transporter (DMT)-like permease
MYFGDAISSPPRPERLSRRSWGVIGGGAIALWATWPVLSLQTQSIPPFEAMASIFFFAWLTLKGWELTPAGADPSSARVNAWIPAFAFALGESGSTVFYLLAIRRISAAEANLVIFLWPALTVGLGASLGTFPLRARHLVGIALGFIGVAVLMDAALVSSLAGVGLALLGSTAWACYCVFRLKWQAPTTSLLSRGFAISSILCGTVHFLAEPSVIPSLRSALAIVIIGIVPTAIANQLWDQSFRRSDSRLLAVMAYGTPLISALLLVALGYEAVSRRLFFGAFIIVAAGIVSKTEKQSP